MNILHNGAITLYHGDCLDVMREIPDGSVDALQREINSIPFDVHVTRVAQTNNVINGIGIVRINERTNGFDMVNIGRTVGRFHYFVAATTCVVIALACSTTQASPIFAIITWMPATPVVITLATIALVSALRGTESITSRTLEGSGNINRFVTRFANKVNRRLEWWARGNYSKPTRRCIADFRTNCNVLGAMLKGLAMKILIAYLARQRQRTLFCRTSHGI